MPTDLYEGMSSFYDDFVQLNRDYRAIADELISTFADGKSILDIGIGTGLLVRQMLDIRPDLRVVGIDSSASLLAQAKQMLGPQVSLHCQDISELCLDETFDVAYSRGGAWSFVREGGKVMLASHILEPTVIYRSFERVVAHLNDRGRLILTTSTSNESKREQVDANHIFERATWKESLGGEQYLCLEYRQYKDESVVASQRLKMLLLDLDRVEEHLASLGLVATCDRDSSYRIYTYRQGEV